MFGISCTEVAKSKTHDQQSTSLSFSEEKHQHEEVNYYSQSTYQMDKELMVPLGDLFNAGRPTFSAVSSCFAPEVLQDCYDPCCSLENESFLFHQSPLLTVTTLSLDTHAVEHATASVRTPKQPPLFLLTTMGLVLENIALTSRQKSYKRPWQGWRFC